MATRYLLDADLVLEGLLDRPKLSLDAVNVWSQLESDNLSDRVYITSIGLNKIIEVLRTLIEIEEDADEVIDSIGSRFQEIQIDREIIQEALELDLDSKDFESAIEIACAKEYKIDAIVTDRKDYFPFPNSKNNFLADYNLKIMNSDEFIIESKDNAWKVTHSKDTSSLSKDVETAIAFADEYGGEDLDDYRERYDVIESYWQQLKDILTLCYQQALNEQMYCLKFLHMWNQLNRFSDLYDRRDDRIHYLNLGIELSSKYSMTNDLFDCLTRKAWALIMQHKLNNARLSLNRAEKIIEEPGIIIERSSLFYFYHCQFTFYTHNDDLGNAEKTLVKLSYLTGAVEGEEINDKSLKRRKINFQRDSAKLDHLQAKANKKENGELPRELVERSLDKYRLCLDDAISISWKRMISYLFNKIADIYLDLAEDCQNDLPKQYKFLETTEGYLDEGQPIATNNRHQRRIAGYNLSRARLSSLKSDYLIRLAQVENQKSQQKYEEAGVSFKQSDNLLKEKECNESAQYCKEKDKQLTKY
jgi:predicted nucleic acid-binding protein